jgi:bacterioferritin
MAEEYKTADLTITREQMLQLLNEDLVREFQAMIQINKHIDYLNEQSETMSDSIKTSNVPVEMLRAVLENERKMAEHYQERIRQADAIGEFALSETLRAIIEQQHELDLSATLVNNAPASKTDKKMFGSQ